MNIKRNVVGFLLLVCFNISFTQSFQLQIDSILNEVKSSKALNKQLSKAYLAEANKIKGTNFILAKQHCLKSYNYSIIANADSLTFKSSRFLGLVYNILRNRDSSLYFCKKSRKYAKLIKDFKSEIILNSVISNSYLKLNAFDSSYSYINHSEDLFNKHDSLKDLTYIFHKMNKGSFFFTFKIYDLSLKEYNEAKHFADSIKDKTFTAQITSSIGVIYKATGNYSEGIKMYKQSLNLYDSLDIDKATTYTNIANVFSDYNELDSSFFYYKKALNLYQFKNSGIQNLNTIYLQIATLYTDKNKSIAIDYLKLINENTLTDYQKCKYLFCKAQLSEVNSQKILFAKKSYNCLTDIKDIELTKEVAYFLYEIYKKNGNPVESLKSFENYTKLKDSIFNKEKSLAIQKVIVENVIKEKDNEINLNNIKSDQEKAKKDKLILIIVLILLGVILVLVLMYFLFRLQKQKSIILLKDKELLKKENEEVRKELTTVSFESDRNKQFLANTKEELKKIRLSSDKESKLNNLYAITNQFVIGENNKREFNERVADVKDDFFNKLDLITKLTKTEKKLAALLKLSMSSKEIAPILNVSEKTVEIYRSRLRKKLNIPKEKTLDLFFNSI